MHFPKTIIPLPFRFILVAAVLLAITHCGAQTTIVNDVTQLNPIAVSSVITPTTTDEIIAAVKTHAGPISIGGGRYSMGGQTATEGALQIDMRQFDKVLAFSAKQAEITVQTGITWRKLQEFIDPYGLSVKIMQTYANFTVGGSLSVNCHGRYVGQGPIIYSVKSIRIVLADGEILTASPGVHADIFYGAIGGYGGLGVITEATLQLAANTIIERRDTLLPIESYTTYFFRAVRHDSLAVFHNGDIYPNRYKMVHAITYRRSKAPLTDTNRLKPARESYKVKRVLTRIVADWPGGKLLRQYVFDPIVYGRKEVIWRNHEASYDVMELEPASRKKSTYVLQEYFVPVSRFDDFYPKMTTILRTHRVNVMNISIRHALRDPGSMLAWAKTEVFAFVLYYKQGTKPADRDDVGAWTRELTDAALDCDGSYYLPYQIHASPAQFARAYPQSAEYFSLKKKLDPTNKFRNKLWDAYYRP